MMLTQPTKLNTSSINIELKSLLIALTIIFFVNTPLSFVKSQRLTSIEQQTSLIHKAIDARQLAVKKAIDIAQLDIIKNGQLSTNEFNNFTHLFLADQKVITTIELRMPRGDIPGCKASGQHNTAQQFSGFHQQTNYQPKSQRIDFYQPICLADNFYAFLYIQIDLYQLLDLTSNNTSVVNYEGQVLGTTDTSLQTGNLFANQYQTFWRELSISDKQNGMVEYDSSAIVYSKIKMFDGKPAYLIQRIASQDLIPSYVYFVVVLIALVIGITIYLYQLRREKEFLSSISYHDQLSGLYNRHYLNKLEQSAEIDSHYLCCLFDIDNFKVINDTYGHDIGDQIIKRVAATIKSRTRPVDYCFRVGGEEFLVLLRTDDNKENALNICQRIRHTISDLEQQPNVTVSCGAHPMDYSLTETMKKADEKLYTAKNNGKNCVVF